jgi:hypothetical protein
MVGGAYPYILFGGLLAMAVVVAMASMMEKILVNILIQGNHERLFRTSFIFIF